MQAPRKTSIVCAAKSSYTWNKSGRKLKLFRGSVLLMFIYLYLFLAVLKITCRILAAQTIEVFWGGSIQKVNHSLSWTSSQCSVGAIVWLGSEFRSQPGSTLGSAPQSLQRWAGDESYSATTLSSSAGPHSHPFPSCHCCISGLTIVPHAPLLHHPFLPVSLLKSFFPSGGSVGSSESSATCLPSEPSWISSGSLELFLGPTGAGSCHHLE